MKNIQFKNGKANIYNKNKKIIYILEKGEASTKDFEIYLLKNSKNQIITDFKYFKSIDIIEFREPTLNFDSRSSVNQILKHFKFVDLYINDLNFRRKQDIKNDMKELKKIFSQEQYLLAQQTSFLNITNKLILKKIKEFNYSKDYKEIQYLIKKLNGDNFNVKKEINKSLVNDYFKNPSNINKKINANNILIKLKQAEEFFDDIPDNIINLFKKPNFNDVNEILDFYKIIYHVRSKPSEFWLNIKKRDYQKTQVKIELK